MALKNDADVWVYEDRALRHLVSNFYSGLLLLLVFLIFLIVLVARFLLLMCRIWQLWVKR